MGIGPKISGGSSGFAPTTGGLLGRGNPNPLRFEVLRAEEFSVPARLYTTGWAGPQQFQPEQFLTIAEVVYPDALTYEGRKVLLYRARAAEIEAASELDPHFQETFGPTVPIARFEPSATGWRLAVGLVRAIQRREVDV